MQGTVLFRTIIPSVFLHNGSIKSPTSDSKTEEKQAPDYLRRYSTVDTHKQASTHIHTHRCILVFSVITSARAVWVLRSWTVNTTTAEFKPTAQQCRYSCWRGVLFHATVFRWVNKLAFTKGDAGAPLPGKELLSIYLGKRKANVVVGETGRKTACGLFVPEFICEWCLHPWRQTVHLHNNICCVGKISHLKEGWGMLLMGGEPIKLTKLGMLCEEREGSSLGSCTEALGVGGLCFSPLIKNTGLQRKTTWHQIRNPHCC